MPSQAVKAYNLDMMKRQLCGITRKTLEQLSVINTQPMELWGDWELLEKIIDLLARETVIVAERQPGWNKKKM